ncbi:AlpA family transcriptional regulator [Bowmanella sp. JS7-9]|uniref:Helix-turn-helix transcriptional regulator n=1 Tax=Pseudobowmanella zhangzhouensis TaxID=1537679 RepID=A0ABW1XNM4_9ALTE|nr:hypothetical protein [Bowmanella sp. JS7-9]TBX21954.1 hypothetical protein TK45_10750 [Bowmanella sp. JS7-9]
MSAEQQVYTIDDLRKLFGKSTHGIENMIARGELPKTLKRRGSRSPRQWRKVDIDKLLGLNSQTAANDPFFNGRPFTIEQERALKMIVREALLAVLSDPHWTHQQQ